jgi:hypothetical protein
MAHSTTRRQFLGATAAGSVLASVADLGFLSQLRPVSADEAKLDPNTVQLRPEIEPLVRLLEETPRDKLLEEVGHRVRAGLDYQQLLAALLLAGVRNIQPRPAVGFKFHAVLVVNSAHLASIAARDEERWLPIFWALDEFKSSQAADVREGNWTMTRVDETRVPTAAEARDAFVHAMDNWDEAAADAAVAGLARTGGVNEMFDLFARFGARDFRAIGHKIIYVSNSWRTLDLIGWQHAEPVLRSLAYALLQHEGDNPAKRDGEPDRPWRANVELAAQIRPAWQDGRVDEGATRDLIDALHSAGERDACQRWSSS